MKRVPFTKKARVKFPTEAHPMAGVFEREFDKATKPKPQLKRTPFTKKRSIKFPVLANYDEEKLALVKKAAKLRGEIFKGLRCALCTEADWDLPTVPHHILNKGNYDCLRFEIWNIFPLCIYHHDDAHKEKHLFYWNLQDVYPRHYRYYVNEKDNRTPVKQTVESLTKIVADLQYYVDHPDEAEQVIYESP